MGSLRDSGETVPLKPKPVSDSSNEGRPAATCYYNGAPYSEGSLICQAGRRMRCTNNGVWSDTGQSCEGR